MANASIRRYAGLEACRGLAGLYSRSARASDEVGRASSRSATLSSRNSTEDSDDAEHPAGGGGGHLVSRFGADAGRAVDGYLSLASADARRCIRFADRPHRAARRPDLLRPGRGARVRTAVRPDLRRDRPGGSLSFRRVRRRRRVSCRRIRDAAGRRGDRRTLRGRDHERRADRPRARRGARARALARNAAAVPAARWRRVCRSCRW